MALEADLRGSDRISWDGDQRALPPSISRRYWTDTVLFAVVSDPGTETMENARSLSLVLNTSCGTARSSDVAILKIARLVKLG